MRMIRDEGVCAVEISFGRVHRLRAADLLGGLAKEFERAFDAEFLHGGLRRKHACERGGAERRMRIGVSGGPGMEALARRLVGHHLLRVAGHRVVLRVAAEHRPALPPRGGEGGRHATRPLLDGEPFRSQQIAIGLRRLVFPPRGLGVLPNLQVKVGEPMGLLVYPIQYKTLVLRESGHDSVASVPSRYIETEYSGASPLKASLPHSAMRIVRPSDIASLRGEAPLLKEPARPLLHHLVAIVRPPLRIV